jgi:hypothetical protein
LFRCQIYMRMSCQSPKYFFYRFSAQKYTWPIWHHVILTKTAILICHFYNFCVTRLEGGFFIFFWFGTDFAENLGWSKHSKPKLIQMSYLNYNDRPMWFPPTLKSSFS